MDRERILFVTEVAAGATSVGSTAVVLNSESIPLAFLGAGTGLLAIALRTRQIIRARELTRELKKRGRKK